MVPAYALNRSSEATNII